MSGQRKANNQRTAHPTAHQGGKQIEIEHMGTETPKEYVGDSITTETCFHMNHHKRVRMYICAPKARNNQHIFNFNHIQLEEGIRKQQATEKKRHEGAKKASHSTHQDSRKEMKQYEQRGRHTRR